MGQEPISISEGMKEEDRESNYSDSVIVVNNPIYGSCVSTEKDNISPEKAGYTTTDTTTVGAITPGESDSKPICCSLDDIADQITIDHDTEVCDG